MQAVFNTENPLILLGCGNMGQALLAGWLKAGVAPDSIVIIDPAVAQAASRADIFRPIPAANIVGKADELDPSIAARAVLLAVKPQMMADALPTIESLVTLQTLVVSVAAGTTIENFEATFGENAQIVRTMPNTPAAVGEGITGLFASSATDDDNKSLAANLMEAVGDIIWLEREGAINALTAVSGSGPAYIFHLVECLAAAAESEGLPAEDAARLARQTVIGAGALLAGEPETSAGELRERVTSPKGTTAAGLDALMGIDRGLGGLIRETVRAARRRGEELGNLKS